MLDVRSWGCGTHLLVVGTLVLVGLGIAVGRNWKAASMMVDNMTAMGEGAAEAEQLRYPRDLVDYLAAHPDRASLVAFDVDAPEEGVWYRADRERPVVRLAQTRLLATYAEQRAAGRLNTTRRLPLDSVAVYAMPGAAEQSFAQTRRRWAERGALRPDSTVALPAVARAAFRHDDPAAADALLSVLGRAGVAEPGAWVPKGAAAVPRPRSGLQLSWMHPPPDTTTAPVDRAYRMFARLRADTAFRHRQYGRLSTRGSGLSLRQQRARGAQSLPRGTADGYARLFARIATGAAGAPEQAESMQSLLERPVSADSLGLSVRTVASLGGALPGVISLAGYAHRTDGRPPRVVVLLLDDLPMAVFYHLLQTGLDKGFQLRLFSDDAFLAQVRRRLGEATATAEPPRGRANDTEGAP
jgi:hypothetical protein